MTDGERRRLVFTNLVNGVSVPAAMAAFHLSEREVMADFHFVCRKLRSYRFERAKPVLQLASIAEARARQVEVLTTLQFLNLESIAKYTKIETLPFTDEAGGGRSPGEQAMFDMRMRAASR